MKSCCAGLGENLDLSSQRTGKFAAIRCASTGGDAGGGGVVCEEMLQLRQGEQGFLEIVESELEEGRLFYDGAGFFEHLGRCVADDGDTDFADTGTEKLGGYARHIRSHVYNRGILQTCWVVCKFLLKQKEVSSTRKLSLLAAFTRPQHLIVDADEAQRSHSND